MNRKQISGPDSPVSALPGVGPKKVEAFEKLGVTTLRELVTLFPRRYEDRSRFTPIFLAVPGDTVCIRAMVAQEPRLNRIRRGMELVKLRAVDDTGAIDVTFFNQSYRKDQLKKGESYIFYGKVGVMGQRKTLTNPVCEPESRAGTPGSITGRIMPVYPLSAGLTQRIMLDAMRAAHLGSAVVHSRRRGGPRRRAGRGIDMRHAADALRQREDRRPKAPAFRSRRILSVAALCSHRCAAACRQRRHWGSLLRRAHEPADPGRRGQRQNPGGRCMHLVCMEKRLPERLHGAD